jgi:hypothetical protein
VDSASLFHGLARKSWFGPRITSRPHDLIDQVTRITLGQRLFHVIGDEFNEMLQHTFIVLNQTLLALPSKDL